MPTDPIFPALSEWQSIEESYAQAYSSATQHDRIDFISIEFDLEDLADKRTAVLADLYKTTPTSFDGLVALVRAFMAEDGQAMSEFGLVGLGMQTICEALISMEDHTIRPDTNTSPRTQQII